MFPHRPKIAYFILLLFNCFYFSQHRSEKASYQERRKAKLLFSLMKKHRKKKKEHHMRPESHWRRFTSEQQTRLNVIIFSKFILISLSFLILSFSLQKWKRTCVCFCITFFFFFFVALVTYSSYTSVAFILSASMKLHMMKFWWKYVAYMAELQRHDAV